MEYDIIGDVHGCHGHLVGLLTSLGYWPDNGVWKHEERTAVFVGDLIDRGPSQWDVIQTVKDMVEAGSAEIVMGNHEFNALAFATVKSENPRTFAREHRPGNIKQHEAFLSQLSPGQQEEALKWFMTMPLWLDLGSFRVVHAYWSDESVSFLENWLGGDRFTKREQILQASVPGSAEYKHVELVLKGPEAHLPSRNYGFKSITDKDSNVREQVRINWWALFESTIEHVLDPMITDKKGKYKRYRGIPVHPEDAKHRYGSPVPVFFGHHWRVGEPVYGRDFADNAFCVDFSAVKDGQLAAYRFNPSQHSKCDPSKVTFYPPRKPEKNKCRISIRAIMESFGSLRIRI